jgi:septal ring factor EnvC (AmiA/AmiB activator)
MDPTQENMELTQSIHELQQENYAIREAMVAMVEELHQLRTQNQEQERELARQRREIYELGRDKDVLFFDLQNWKPAEPEPKRKCVMDIED